jgi:transposase
MSPFEWTKKREIAALSLARGDSYSEAGDTAGVSRRTIIRWMQESEFAQEVDRLSLMTEIAGRAHRLHLANRVIRQMVRDGQYVVTTKDLLDWLKHAQGETDGVKLDLVNLLDGYGDEDSS